MKQHAAGAHRKLRHLSHDRQVDMLFSLLHNPCSKTPDTLCKGTRSVKWTAVAALLPLAVGFSLCFLVSPRWRLFGAA